MIAPLPNYFRPLRRRSGLDQNELSMLFGRRDGPAISKYERFVRAPNLETVIAYAAIFDVPLADLFPGKWAAAKRRVRVRARLLEMKLARLPASARRQRKRTWLRHLINDNQKKI